VDRKIADPACPEWRDKRRRFRPHGRGCDPSNGTQHAFRVTRDAATPPQAREFSDKAVWLSADAAHLKDD
jgi:hypothetical protein